MKKRFFLLLLLVEITSWLARAENSVTFNDANLKVAVQEELAVTDPTPTDMLALTSLTAKSRGISDLTGLGYATNLASLDLTGNQISDISILSNFTNLTQLALAEMGSHFDRLLENGFFPVFVPVTPLFSMVAF